SARTQGKIAKNVKEAKDRALAILAKDRSLAGAELTEENDFVRTVGRWDVEGSGKGREDAVQAALEKAYGQVAIYLHSRYPGLQWPVSTDFIRDKLVKQLTIEE